MQYENLKRATDICNEIEGHEKLLERLDDSYYVVSCKISNGNYGTIHNVELRYESNEALKLLATNYRNQVAQYYRNRIESLKTELEKL